ncbi:MAG TPA: 50S ribosomal protein L21 [Flavisolibacter sp.]|jgi:large subunit ribosomal protein L21|nr:50S ribosomal protein L21 [Flavisolibacter sp.]
MFAIVKIAGKQFKVEKDQTLYVPKLGGDTGSMVEFSDIVMSDSNGNLTFSSSGIKIQAEILNHVQGDKVIAYKQKRRKGFRKKKGHRTEYTKIKINDIA